MGFLSRKTLFCAAGGALLIAAAVVGFSRWHHARRKRVSARTSGPDFAREVQPIFSENCLECHGPRKEKGGLRLDAKDTAYREGESGEIAIVPADPAKSAVLRRITSSDPDEQMPPKGHRLPKEKIELLRRWIVAGADWPVELTASAPAPAGMTVTDKDRQYWAFRPLERMEPPSTAQNSSAQNPIDQFIFAAQDAKGVHTNAPASKGTLIRRLYFDLIGLPPAPEEVDAFEKDASPDAYEHLVDRLLADPHYGERWGRHWLDCARYADSAGYEEDRPRPDAWHYRDFVVRAFNSDLPYDRFIQWQIAGDLLAPNDQEALAATGFITAAPDVRPDFINFRKKDRADELDDIVATTGSAMLGLTLGCARCHDHKFDPIPTADYYRLTAFFTSTKRIDRPLDPAQGEDYERRLADFEKRLKQADKERKKVSGELRDRVRLARIAALPISESDKALLRASDEHPSAAQKELLHRFQDQLDFNEKELRASLSDADRAKLEAVEKAEDALEATKPSDIPRMLVIEEDGQPQKSYLLPRGDVEHPGPEVTPAFLSVLSPGKAPTPSSRLTRVDLARWLTDDVHGAGALLARVAINHLWQHHFGRGLVDTPGDFGARGDPPTNPALLDWLASELIRNGWRSKVVQKEILLSAVYRQDVAFDAKCAEIDPANDLWWRREPERLEAEALRDSILSVSGQLNAKLFGPAVKPPIAPEAITVTNPSKHYDEWPRDVVDGPEMWRRSIYIFAKRANLFPFLQAFDAPNAVGSCTRRNPTTVAPQALALMNDSFVRARAKDFATRLTKIGSGEARIASAFLLAFGRKPAELEVAKSLSFLADQTREYRSNANLPEPDKAALADFCQALIASNEFSSID